MKKRIDIDKKNIVIFLVILGVIVIICSNFLRMHFSSDTYVLYDLGYFEYPSQYFLPDGRLISALFCYLGGILHLPIPVYIVLMDFMGMIFLAIAIYIVANIFKNIIKPNTITKEVLIYLSLFVLILNQYTLEYLLFPESAVMCLGVLFIVLAVKEFVGNNKHKYLKIFLFLLLTGLSYQGELNIFPCLVILVMQVKQIIEQRKLKEFIKESIIEILKITIIIIAVIGICYIFIKFFSNICNVHKKSIIIPRNIQSYRRKISWVKYYARDILVYCISMFPKYSILICPIITVFLLIIEKTKINTIISYMVYYLISIASVILPLIILTAAVCARLSVPVMMIFGGSLIIIIANSKNNNKKIVEKLARGMIIIFFIINSAYIIINTTEHIAANRVDEIEGKQIKLLLDKYEEETGKKVTNFTYKYDANPQQFANGIKPMQSLTERKLSCTWSIKQAINYYCERKFKFVDFDYFLFSNEDFNLMEYQMMIKDYSCFSEEQIIFKDDTMYMIVY